MQTNDSHVKKESLDDVRDRPTLPPSSRYFVTFLINRMSGHRVPFLTGVATGSSLGVLLIELLPRLLEALLRYIFQP